MGTRYYLSVTCPKCKFTPDEFVYYAPTCGFIVWECPKCNEVINLEKYSGIDAEGCANTPEGVKAVKELRKELGLNKKKKKKWKSTNTN